MKILAEFKNVEPWVEKRKAKIQTQLGKGMEYVLALIRGRSQAYYLHGPYPTKLRIGHGSLLKNIGIKTEVLADKIIGKITIGSLAWYGKIWESVGEYSHRKGGIFPKAGTPKSRPFIRPAFEDLREKINRILKEEGVK